MNSNNELLDKVKTELEMLDGNNPNGQSFLKDIINSMFEGELVSQVTCLECKNVSERTEPFLDLSLEFPDRYQITNKNSRIAEDMCHVTVEIDFLSRGEMLAKFTDEESLEGKIYQCDKCNSRRNDKKGSTTKTTIYTEAKKRLLVKKLPHVLRLHLKRFRWSGRLHREKINTHVAFNDVIDMKPFCDLTSLDEYGYEYKLHSVIMHHGKGFGCGHYTAFCWNQEAGNCIIWI
ncbi:hypothetical protein KUTeg_001018 [Tegillarca granosa]|uniref:USP domain-containing protein n=1 Tax=Tegillarca granosa TaxID=220873 RepID=A0ABQ9FZ66_TEGGR|nr:hypothetical protein KUTeg_001018 [Tegillarca granosa]